MKRLSSRRFLLFFAVLFVLSPKEASAADTTLIGLLSLPYNINTIASDSAGTIWLTGARGLEYYDFEKEAFVIADPFFKEYNLTPQGIEAEEGEASAERQQ